MFTPGRLTLARKRRRLTRKGLADRAGLSALTVSRLEKGACAPSRATLDKLAHALDFPVAFFSGAELDLVDPAAVSFRSRSTLGARERDAATAAAELGVDFSAWIEARFTLPETRLPDLSHETDPELAAEALRQHWGLGVRPIGNMLRLLEAHGVRVFFLSENTAAVDAFSFWKPRKPFVFLNTFKTAERSVFDAAHELGHLVLHERGGAHRPRNEEREADHFAAAFLMPAQDLIPRMPKLITVRTILAAKRRWKTSALALTRRLHSLSRITDWQYKTICIQLARLGYRSREPDGCQRETSAIWPKVFTHLWSEGMTGQDIADALNLPLDELTTLIRGAEEAPPRPTKRNLRAVSATHRA